MKRALIFGGTGQCGSALAEALALGGWSVTVTARPGRPLPDALLNLGTARRDAPDTRASLMSEGWDAAIDMLAFTRADARDLLAARADVGRLVVISTASVYADDQGRGFETEGEFPAYPVPIPETQMRVAEGEGYSAGKVGLENRLVEDGRPVSILRPGAIHGIGAKHPREWVFVKRCLDGRRALPLAQAGQTRFHTTSTRAMADFTRHLLDTGQDGTFNIADETCLTTAEIARAVARHFGHDFAITDAEDLPEPLGHTPFSTTRPVALDLAAARATGWRPPPYATHLPPYLDWIAANAPRAKAVFATFANYPHDPFDYAAEDAALGISGQNP